jgi:hypothetical protein
MRLKNKKYKNLTVKNLDYYDEYYSGYGLYDKLKNMVDNDNLSML